MIASLNELARVVQSELEASCSLLSSAGFPDILGEHLKSLAVQLTHPCTLAVVGKAKAGKSTFVNAMLETDLAVVGVSETTATVNRFTYSDSDMPEITCAWLDGARTKESPQFLARISGHDEETLKLTASIHQIEFALRSPILQKVDIVDTPGLGAEVDEHQDQTAKFLGLVHQVRTKNHEHTKSIAQQADALLYLFDPVAKEWERDSLNHFGSLIQKGTNTFNSLGVIGKLDVHFDSFDQAERYSDELNDQIGGSISKVLPTSIGLWRTARLIAEDSHCAKTLEALVWRCTAEQKELLFASDKLFLSELCNELCDVAGRSDLLKALPWATLKYACRLATETERGSIGLPELFRKESGFDAIIDAVNDTFVARGDILRCYRIVCEAESALQLQYFGFLEECRLKDKHQQELRKRLLEYLNRLKRMSSKNDRALVAELEEFVDATCGRVMREPSASALTTELLHRFSEFKGQLESYSTDLTVLQSLARCDDLTMVELGELQQLFGMEVLDIQSRMKGESQDELRERQKYWRNMHRLTGDPIKQLVSGHAVDRLGQILYSSER